MVEWSTCQLIIITCLKKLIIVTMFFYHIIQFHFHFDMIWQINNFVLNNRIKLFYIIGASQLCKKFESWNLIFNFGR
jgi:hypothetical protein